MAGVVIQTTGLALGVWLGAVCGAALTGLLNGAHKRGGDELWVPIWLIGGVIGPALAFVALIVGPVFGTQ